MRVLGIDPGSRITGLGVVELKGRELIGIQSQAVRLGSGELSLRLGDIYQAVTNMILETKPDVVAVEQVFMATNAKAALILGHARGSAVCAAVNAGVPVVEYSAKQIKQAVVGTGGADKAQVQHMVRILLRLTKTPQSDAADALACAICHAHTAQLESKLQQGQQRRA
ncbi:MAG: crossover junction endodeoxyribonuclease RuvC [Saprospiraceae bacterium]|jgi:crossover junction endodeoxyribonuclease RuvC